MMRHLWPLAIGFGLWALAFVAIYALQYLGCHLRWDPATHRALLVAAYLASIGLLALTLLFQIRRANGRQSAAVDRVGVVATIAALAAAIVAFAPVLAVSICL